MAELADDIIDALEVIADFGVEVVISRVVNGTMNRATGKFNDDEPETISPVCVTEDKGRWIDGVTVGEKYLIFAAAGLAFAPAPGMTFSHNGEGFAIMDKGVKGIEVQGVVVAYEVWGIRS